MIPEGPSFSIVIPSFNRPEGLRDCLLSLNHLHYAHAAFEVIVVDDGGDEDLRLHPSISGCRVAFDFKIIRQKNGGPGAARNRGAAEASKDFVVFIDDDCRPEKEWLALLAKRFLSEPEAVVGGRTLNALANNLYAITSQMIVDMVYEQYNRVPDQARFFAACHVAFPRLLFNKIGGFDPAFWVSEDRELCDRLLAQGERLIYAEELRIHHAEEIDFTGFCERHFGYGRGAYQFHKMRSVRHSGDMRQEIQFHASFGNWLFYPFRKPRQKRAFAIMCLLLLWQGVNAAGFFWEALYFKRPPKFEADHRG